MPRIEVLPNTTVTSAPGWAYVAVPADGYLDPSKAPIIPTGSRRSKVVTTTSDANVSSTRQQAAIHKRLAELDRDGSAGKEIAVPDVSSYVTGSDGTGTASRKLGKTPSTRKIFLSAKTFANHLADEEAARAQEHNQSAAVGTSRSRKKSSIAVVDRDVVMEDAPQNQECLAGSTVANEEQDLVAMPKRLTISQAEMDELLAAPALSYNAARAAPPDENGPPSRAFCEICGYWGRVKCIKCGAKVCSLDCKEQHMVECSRRYA